MKWFGRKLLVVVVGSLAQVACGAALPKPVAPLNTQLDRGLVMSTSAEYDKSRQYLTFSVKLRNASSVTRILDTMSMVRGDVIVTSKTAIDTTTHLYSAQQSHNGDDCADTTMEISLRPGEMVELLTGYGVSVESAPEIELDLTLQVETKDEACVDGIISQVVQQRVRVEQIN